MAIKQNKYKKGDMVKYHIDYGASPMLAKSKAEKSKEKEGRISKVKKGFLGKGWDYMINNITIPHSNIVGLIENKIQNTRRIIMKITKTQLVELIKEVLQEETEHQKFFKATLKKFGAKTIADLGDRKAEFFKAIDANKVTDDEKEDVEETLEPVSQAAGKPKYNPTQSLSAKKRNQILAQEKVENYVRKLVREELKFVMFNEVPGTISRKVAKKRIAQTGSTTKSL